MSGQARPGQATVHQNTPILLTLGVHSREMTQQLKGFNTYEDYLDSQLVEEDLYYLKVIINDDLTHICHADTNVLRDKLKYFLSEDVESARLILVLGYRSGVKVHGKEEFYRERTSVSTPPSSY